MNLYDYLVYIILKVPNLLFVLNSSNYIIATTDSTEELCNDI